MRADDSAAIATHETNGSMTTPQSIVFFDGVCGLCNAAVDVLLRADRRKALLFAPLQGETARQRLSTAPDAAFDTIILLDAHGRHERSDAALRICQHLGGLWRLWLVFWLIPRPVRDSVYGFIARNRYAWFGQKAACRLPTPAERERFLP